MRRIKHLRKRTGAHKRSHFLYKLLWITLGILLLLTVIIPGISYIFPRVFRNARAQNSGNNHTAISLLPNNSTTMAHQAGYLKWQNSSISPKPFSSPVSEQTSNLLRREHHVTNEKKQHQANTELHQLLLSIKPHSDIRKTPDTELSVDQQSKTDINMVWRNDLDMVRADHSADAFTWPMYTRHNPNKHLIPDNHNDLITDYAGNKIITQRDHAAHLLEKTSPKEQKVTHLIFNNRLISFIPVDDAPLAEELINAFAKNNFQAFSRIVRLGVSYPLVLDGDKITPFLKFAVIEKLTDYIKVVLKYYPADIYVQNENPLELLSTAVMTDNLDAVILLTDKYKEYGQEYLNHVTNLASRFGQFTIVRYLIDTGLYIPVTRLDKLSLLFEAFYSNNKMLIEYLDSLDTSAMNYIFPKAQKNVLQFIISTLLADGENPNLTIYGKRTLQGILTFFPHLMHGKDNQGNTPLHTAVLFGSDQVVSMLLDAGADIFDRNNNNQTPYMLIGRNNVAILKAFSEKYQTLRRWDYFQFWINYQHVEFSSRFYWIVGVHILGIVSGAAFHRQYKYKKQQQQQMLAELNFVTKEVLDSTWQHESGQDYSIKLNCKRPEKLLKYVKHQIECNYNQLTLTPSLFPPKVLSLLKEIYGQDKVAIVADRLIIKNVAPGNIKQHTLNSVIVRFCEEIVISSAEYQSEIEIIQSIIQQFFNNHWTMSNSKELIMSVSMKSPEELAKVLPSHLYKSLTLRPEKARDIIVMHFRKYFSDKIVSVSNDMPFRITLQIMRITRKRSEEIVKDISLAIIENSDEYLSERVGAIILQLKVQYQSLKLVIDQMKQESKFAWDHIVSVSDLRKMQVEDYRQECRAQFQQPQQYIIEQENRLIAMDDNFKTCLRFALQYVQDKDHFESRFKDVLHSKLPADVSVVADELAIFLKKTMQFMKEISLKTHEFKTSNANFNTKLAKLKKKFASEGRGKRDKDKLMIKRDNSQREDELLEDDLSNIVTDNKISNAAKGGSVVKSSSQKVVVRPAATAPQTQNNNVKLDILPDRLPVIPLASIPDKVVTNKVATLPGNATSQSAVPSFSAAFAVEQSLIPASPGPSSRFCSVINLEASVPLGTQSSGLFYTKMSLAAQQKSPRLLAEKFKDNDDLYTFLKTHADSIEYFSIKEEACLDYINLAIHCITIFFKDIADENSLMALPQLYERLKVLIKIIEEYATILRDIFRHTWIGLNNAKLLEHHFVNSSAIFSGSLRQDSAARIFHLCRLVSNMQPCIFEEPHFVDIPDIDNGSMLMKQFGAPAP